MTKIIVQSFDGKNVKEQEFEDIGLANKTYEKMHEDSKIKACSIVLKTTTVLKGFNR